MKFDRSVPVAIVGAGFSGTMVAAQLARRGIASLLIEPRDVAGRGTAFSTGDPAHLLNVPAGNMSAWPELPDDFATIAGDKRAFAQRRVFGDYLRRILAEAAAKGAELVRDRAVSAVKVGKAWKIALESGMSVKAEALVLAIGNQLPDAPRYAEGAGDRLIADPWGDAGRAAVAKAARDDSDVLIVGTGLTMVDIMLSLDRARHKGRVLALSRRGLAPRGHADSELLSVDADAVPHGSLRALFRWLRERSEQSGWRAAIDSLRPHSQRLWQSLDTGEQDRFLRHARPWWDVHRHRIAPQVARQVAGDVEAGRLEIAAGRIQRIERDGNGLDVSFRRRGSDELEHRRVAFAFNCTGPLHAIGRTRDPLLRQLIEGGIVQPDALGIGLEVDTRSRAEGTRRLWALGALTKGRYWEIIAVPDIRGQAADIANDIAMELHA